MNLSVFQAIARFFGSLLIHPIWGRVMGAIAVAAPLSLLGWPRMRHLFQQPALFGILALPTVYLMLFFGALTHELGHIVVLRLMGCKSTLQIMKHSHSRLIPFNMKTSIAGDSPAYSTSNRLLARGLAGFGANLTTDAILMVLSVAMHNPWLALFAAVQGFSGHGATSWSRLDGDTDVRTIREALAFKDSVSTRGSESDGQLDLDLIVDLEISQNVVTPYWVMVAGIAAADADCEGEFLSFNAGNALLMILPRAQTGRHVAHVRGRKVGPVSLTTKTGYNERYPAPKEGPRGAVGI